MIPWRLLKDIQSGNSSEIGHNNSRVGGNEDLDGPDALQKEEDAPGHPVICSMSKGKSYLVKGVVLFNSNLL